MLANIFVKSVPALTFQAERSRFRDAAPLKVALNEVTLDTSQAPISWLNELADANVLARLVTFEVLKLLKL